MRLEYDVVWSGERPVKIRRCWEVREVEAGPVRLDDGRLAATEVPTASFECEDFNSRVPSVAGSGGRVGVRRRVHLYPGGRALCQDIHDTWVNTSTVEGALRALDADPAGKEAP